MIFCNVQNVNGLAESSHKNWIYCVSQNVMESIYGLMSVNINPQKDHLNMNLACCVCLCVNEWRRRMVLFTIHKAIETLCDI